MAAIVCYCEQCLFIHKHPFHHMNILVHCINGGNKCI